MPNSYITSGKNQDITGRVLTYDYQDFTDAATIAVTASQFHTVCKIEAITGNTTITCNTTNTFGIGSELVVLITPAITSPASTFTVTAGTGFKAVGTASITGAKHAVGKFYFDGSYWVGSFAVSAS